MPAKKIQQLTGRVASIGRVPPACDSIHISCMCEAASASVSKSKWGDYVRRCAGGDESALAALYDQSSSLAYSVALRILRNEADAAEVVLDVYRQVWDSASRFDEQRGTAAAWIVILARSRAMDRRRRQIVRARTAVALEEVPDAVSPEASPENLVISNQSSRAVMRALAAIPLEQRQALELAFFAGLSHAEVADRLGEPLGTVKTRIRLAVHKLRGALKDAV